MTSVVAAIGHTGARQLSAIGGLARFTLRVVRTAGRLSRAGRLVTLRVLVNQIRFTALQAVGLVTLLDLSRATLRILAYNVRLSAVSRSNVWAVHAMAVGGTTCGRSGALAGPNDRRTFWNRARWTNAGFTSCLFLWV